MVDNNNYIKIKGSFAVKVANMVLVSGMLCSILIAIYAIYRIYNPIYSFYMTDFVDISIESKVNQLRYFVFTLCSGISAILIFYILLTYSVFRV